MSSSKKIDLFAGGDYMSEAQNPIHTVYKCTIYLSTQRRGERGELNKREGKGVNSSQSWVENTKMADCISSL